MNNQGWIKIHRKLLDNPIAKKPLIAWFFVYCLLKANHDDKKIIWNKKEIVISRGSFVSGLQVMSRESGVSTQSIRTALVTLKSTNILTIKTTTKFSIITILNYEQYQELTNKSTNDQQTTNKQLTTNKNDKNEKKEKESIKEKELPYQKKDYLINQELLKQDYQDLAKDLNANFVDVRRAAEKAYNWLEANGVTKKNYKAFLRNWLSRDHKPLFNN